MNSRLVAVFLAFATVLCVSPAQSAQGNAMVGVIDGVTNGNRYGGFDLVRGPGDRYSFLFRTRELTVDHVHWSNLMLLVKHDQKLSWISLGCPRRTPCTIVIGKTRVRVEYYLRDGQRYATNLTPIDPLTP